MQILLYKTNELISDRVRSKYNELPVHFFYLKKKKKKRDVVIKTACGFLAQDTVGK